MEIQNNLLMDYNFRVTIPGSGFRVSKVRSTGQAVEPVREGGLQDFMPICWSNPPPNRKN